MSVAAQVNERLAALTRAGVSVWLDEIKRGLITGGELERMVREDSLRGVTSNPAIFEKAIIGANDYDDQLRELAQEDLDARDIYRRLAIVDIQGAADVLKSVYDEAEGGDGFVSFEVDPDLAFDTDRTIAQAREYWQAVDRPNLFIKIPGTLEGVPAIEQAIYEGINVNVTLLFAVEAYEQVAEAYIKGLERRHAEGKPLNVASVASFFVSRVDSEVDKRLDGLGREDLQGTAAVANARAAYQRFKEIFGDERFSVLREAGARVQRPLWASTGVKNPNYPETKYVAELVAPDTVNTMPMKTLHACAEELEVEENTADRDPATELTALVDAGIDMKDVTDVLLKEAVDKFIQPMEKLLAGVESQREAVVLGRPSTIEAVIPSELEPGIAEIVKRAVAEDVPRRVWHKDETLWGGPGPEIGDRLGWLGISDVMLEQVDDLRAFADEVKADGLTDAVLLGMGGSSLAPEVLRRSFQGNAQGAVDGLRLHVLDTTDPVTILELQSQLDLEKTLFIVSSKSGGTIETLSHYKHFRSKVDDGSHFVAVTDPGSPLEQIAKDGGFRRVFPGDPEIGGRYSALSNFGLVPAVLMGVDIQKLLEGAQVAEQACQHYDSSRSNSGLWLGLVMGQLAKEGRDKVTFVVDEPIESFGLWVEQLIAESTGKQGRGILPVAGEPLGPPEAYGNDRVFVHLRNARATDDPGFTEEVAALAKAGHPTVSVQFEGPEDLGRVFFFAEFAVAVAGWVLGINAFNQPNVQEAKDNTNKVLKSYEEKGHLPELADADDAALGGLLGKADPPHYVAVMGYLPFSEAIDEAVDELRVAIRGRDRATTTFGYGPRFLHSTGQLHKGGPPNGLFLQLVHDPTQDAEIPDEPYSFGTLIHAQAIGDLQTLRDHGLPAERVRLEGDLAAAVRSLAAKVKDL
jgi:transaldolase/glucose-6-phosphate isomerase